MGPHAIIASAYDWSNGPSPYHGWTDEINSLWWPRGESEFSTCLLLIDDRRNDLLKAMIAIQSAASGSANDLSAILSSIRLAKDKLSSLRPGDSLFDLGPDTDLEEAIITTSFGAVSASAGNFSGTLVSSLRDDLASTLSAAIAASNVASSSLATRPYIILSAMLSPKEAAKEAEIYKPSGMTEDDVSDTAETELMAWKLYPLAPVRLPDSGGDQLQGLWLLPLVCLRYFRRLTPLNDISGGSATAASDSFPVVTIDHDEADPPWMPPLRAYPDDLEEPSDYTAITGNGTHPDISANDNWHEAVRKQARMSGWRVVCRDVRSNWNAEVDQTQHTEFTGILADYPDNPTDTQRAAWAAPVNRGNGYKVGDILKLVGGTQTERATFSVTAVGANGAVTAVEVKTTGSYSEVPDSPANTNGDGNGCTLRVEWYSRSYHGDAIRLAGYPGNRISGGASDTDTIQDLIARKIQFLFALSGDDSQYSIVIYPTQEDPTSVNHFAEDTNGAGTEERTHIPKVFLGVEANSRDPASANRAAMVAAAKQWALLYYRWRRRQCFYKFPGIAPIIPNGHASIIRWDFGANKYETTYVAIEGIEGTEEGCCFERQGFYACIDGEGALGDGLDGYYAFHELLDSSGTLTTKSGGRVGYVRNVNDETETINPARSDNDKRAVPVGMTVWMKPGVPYLDVTTGEIFDHYRFTTDDLLQVIRLSLTGERNSYGHYGARVKRWNPDTKGFDDSELIWAVLLS